MGISKEQVYTLITAGSTIKFMSLLLCYWIYFYKLKTYFHFKIFSDRGT